MEVLRIMRILAVLLAAVLALPARAQLPDTTFTEEQAQRDACFDYYHFGSVQFDIDEEKGTVVPYRAGETVEVRGRILNPNDYPLPQGKVVAYISREDDRVSADNWHPGVEQIILPNVFDVPAQESVPFTFAWKIPSHAPAGMYHAEFSYLAGGRYVISGIPYVTNFAGGRAFFTVEQPGTLRAASFLRDTVRLNKSPLKLRSVPPVLSANVPVTIDVDIEALGNEAIPVSITKHLYAWSSSDQTEPIIQETEQRTLIPGQKSTVAFRWTDQRPGAYELVITATPQEPGVEASIIKIRFPVEGNVPRIVYSGIGGYEGDDAIVATCVVNATVGTGGEGTISTQIVSDGTVVGSGQGVTRPDYLTTLVTRAPIRDIVAGTLDIATQVTDDKGNVTDSHILSYGRALLPFGQLEDPTRLTAEQQQNATPVQSNRFVSIALIVIAFLLIVAAAVGYVAYTRKSETTPS